MVKAGFTHLYVACSFLLTSTIDLISSDSLISWKKHVISSSTYSNWAPSRILDGNTRRDPDHCGCCSSTELEFNPWYQVDLGRQHVVNRIKIDGRQNGDYGQHFNGMQIYFKSVHEGFTNPEFTEINNYHNVDIRLPVPKTTRYVSLVLKDIRRHFTICELFIYGECAAGEFGYYCDRRCYCEGEPCNTTSGVCSSGKCLAGYRGDYCEQICQSRTYGSGCTETCGKCYQNAACNITNGICPGGCQRGYRGLLCILKCKAGTYGLNCNKTCGNCVNGEPCNAIAGICENGCSDGYRSNYCDLKCQAGTFGKNCSEMCGNCKNGDNCLHTNGTCPNGCKPGFEGDLCKKECREGFYGENCRSTCGQCLNREPCNSRTGYCTAGCQPGYINDFCNKTCDDGHYGNGCLQDCGNCEANTICNKDDGICSSGCESGYKLPMCSEECDDGKYGRNCQNACGFCSNNTACNKQNGTCASCQPGYGGHDCFVVLLQQTGGSDTDQTMTSLIGGVIGGVLALMLLIIVVVIIRRRPAMKARHSDETSNNNLKNHENARELQKISDTPLVIKPPRKERQKGNPSPLTTKVLGKDGQQTNTCPPVAVSVGEHLLQATVSNIVKIDKINDCEKETDGSTIQTKSPSQEENVYYEFISRKKELKVCQIWDYIYQKKRDGCSLFYEEFDLLKSGLIHAHNTAMLKENKAKNRYRGLCAYDHCRVPLEAEEGESEYINASFIHGTDKVKKFIASQGPTLAMRDDFWRMIWQQNSRQIVMLTNLIEMGNEKCLIYWPESTSDEVTYGNITIELESELREADYVIRRLKVRKKGGERISVTQYHFRAWPDKDVPDSTWSLVNFWLHVMNGTESGHGPIVTHCSAGIGRTGTFIALDNAYHQAKLEGVIRILDIVASLREQRVNMVQTKDQYVFLHEAVADALLFGTHYIWSSQFQHVHQYLTEEVDGIKCQRMKTQYQLIVDSMEDRKQQVLDGENDVEYSNVIMNKHVSKSSHTDSLSRLFNNEHHQELGAVLLPNFKEENTFMITKSPTNSTAESFWSMVAENNVKTIISVREQSSKAMNLEAYQTEQENFKISISEKNQTTFHGEIAYTYELNGASKTVRHFVFTDWGDNAIFPDNTRSMLGFLEIVLDWQQHLTPDTPVLVYCSTSERSGLFCVLLNELERMKRDEGHINIIEVVKMLKQRRDDIIPNFEQFKYVHDVILSSFDRGKVTSERSGLFCVLLNELERMKRDEGHINIIEVVKMLKQRRDDIIPNFEQFKYVHDVILSSFDRGKVYANC